MDDRTAYACLAVVIVIGLALAAFMYSGPLIGMDDEIIYNAMHMLNGTFNITSTPYAFGYLQPALVAVSFASFGVSAFTAIIPTLIEYVSLIIIAFLAGKTLFNNEVGLLSGILIITMPTVLGFATQALVDMLMGVLVGLIVYALALAIKHREHRQRMSLSAGLMCGLMAFVKIGGVGIAIPILIAILLLDRKLIMAFVIGLVVSLLIYTATFYMLSGWKASILSALEEYSQNQMTMASPNKPSILLNSVTMLDVLVGPPAIWQVLPLGLITLFIAFSTYFAFKNGDKRLLYPALMFWFTFFYLFFGTESVHSYALIVVVTRYFLLVSIPMAVLAAYALFDMYETFQYAAGARFAFGLLVLCIVLILVSNIPSYRFAYAYKLYILGSVKPNSI
jgi:4-amino-4-deoxy-L-arabinose transferase-like glycosyltransferase